MAGDGIMMVSFFETEDGVFAAGVCRKRDVRRTGSSVSVFARYCSSSKRGWLNRSFLPTGASR